MELVQKLMKKTSKYLFYSPLTEKVLTECPCRFTIVNYLYFASLFPISAPSSGQPQQLWGSAKINNTNWSSSAPGFIPNIYTRYIHWLLKMLYSYTMSDILLLLCGLRCWFARPEIMLFISRLKISSQGQFLPSLHKIVGIFWWRAAMWGVNLLACRLSAQLSSVAPRRPTSSSRFFVPSVWF